MRQRWGWGWFAFFAVGTALNGWVIYVVGNWSFPAFAIGFGVSGMMWALCDILDTAIEKESLEKF